MPNHPAKISDVSFPKSQARLRAMGTGGEGQVVNLDLPNPHFLPYMEYLGGVMYIYSLRKSIVSKPWNCMEMSNHTYSKSVWSGNTIPVVWNTF